MHPHISALLRGIELEEKEQVQRYRLDQQHTLKQLKAEGLAIHPIIVTRKSFGFADYPEISFKLSFPPEISQFKDGAAIECFKVGEEPVKGVLLSLDGKNGEFRLFAPDFPDWIEEDAVGIKLAPDTRTTGIMKKVITNLEKQKELYNLFEKLQGDKPFSNEKGRIEKPPVFQNKALNESQQQAVMAVMGNKNLVVVHGPPGTGKTTTLIEAILQLVQSGEKVLVSAPSNTAVDNIAKGLIERSVNLLRVGNLSKVDEKIFNHTPEGKMISSRVMKEIKQMKIRAEEFRRMALKYKRSFGKAEREQRNLLFKEVRSIRDEIRNLQHYHEEKMFREAAVIAGTPIGLYDAEINHLSFQTLVMDEAGQCIEPLAWCIFPLAEKYVLAGDHFQLPPTVLSQAAVQAGFNRSILEIAMNSTADNYLLDTQYRMRRSIAGFSNTYFYQDRLNTHPALNDIHVHITFIDTAGSGYQEKKGPDGTSLQNEGELHIVQQILEQETFDETKTAFISPYAGQVTLARDQLRQPIRISTIDSFQGQEKDNIIISLVRSNDEGEIGFLKDYRRMNVAMTRAKEQLIIIGDSATLGADHFYKALLEYTEERGRYRSVWEFDMH
ncbi:MAG: AAA family ATPase [Terrimonas sp.]|nr:AAA family ATPase [Terrimonas sp.]